VRWPIPFKIGQLTLSLARPGRTYKFFVIWPLRQYARLAAFGEPGYVANHNWPGHLTCPTSALFGLTNLSHRGRKHRSISRNKRGWECPRPAKVLR
jgi:hypothetical protein